MTTAEIISAIAAGASVIAIIISWRANKKSNINAGKANEIQAQLLELEQSRESEKDRQKRRAEVVLKLVSELSSRGQESHRLNLYNNGESEARKIQVKLNGKPISDIDRILTDENEPEIILGPHSSCGWIAAICMGFAPPWEAVVTWEDESGELGKYRTTLTI